MLLTFSITLARWNRMLEAWSLDLSLARKTSLVSFWLLASVDGIHSSLDDLNLSRTTSIQQPSPGWIVSDWFLISLSPWSSLPSMVRPWWHHYGILDAKIVHLPLHFLFHVSSGYICWSTLFFDRSWFQLLAETDLAATSAQGGEPAHPAAYAERYARISDDPHRRRSKFLSNRATISCRICWVLALHWLLSSHS